MVAPEEEREFIRVDDCFFLNWQPAEDITPETAHQDEIAELDEQLRKLLNSIYHDAPAISEALGLINRKMSLIHGLDDFNGGVMPEVNVNISVSGVGFESDRPAAPGDVISIKMLLRPSRSVVRIKMKVRDCEASPQGSEFPYVIRGYYTDGQEYEVEQIAHYVAFRQTELLAARRRENEPKEE